MSSRDIITRRHHRVASQDCFLICASVSSSELWTRILPCALIISHRTLDRIPGLIVSYPSGGLRLWCMAPHLLVLCSEIFLCNAAFRKSLFVVKMRRRKIPHGVKRSSCSRMVSLLTLVCPAKSGQIPCTQVTL